jgi:sterol desaturase/sphingolipid hydroxylase (fatty acid hydroxylase superfamily)
MDDILARHEALIRFGVFFGLLAAMGLWETLAPRRPLRASRGFRWLNNLGLVAVDTLALRVLFPVLAVAFAEVARVRGWGAFNWLAAPAWVAVPVSFLALDFLIYLQHRLFHAVPALWRLHMVHHADPDIDATTGVRFHPVEIVLSMLIKFAAIAVLGAPALSVLLFEIVLNGTAVFNHANIRIPAGADRWLRRVVVTPDMHRVHHSVIVAETNSNFGFNFPWWDRLLGTYRDQPRDGHAGMTIGLKQFQGRLRQGLWWMLTLPLAGEPGAYPRHPVPNPRA